MSGCRLKRTFAVKPTKIESLQDNAMKSEENVKTETKMIRWTCTYCGSTSMRPAGIRPTPGVCPRKPKTKDGLLKPHTWAKG